MRQGLVTGILGLALLLSLRLEAHCAGAVQAIAPSHLAVVHERIEYLKARHNEPIRVYTLNPHVDLSDLRFEGKRQEYKILGVPTEAKFEIAGSRVFRHYTESQSSLQNILETQTLTSGIIGLTQASPNLFRAHYEDLTGVFLTFRNVTPERVGVDHRYFVDLKIAAETPVVELEQGNVILIPLPRRHPDWMVQIYENFLLDRSLSDYDERIAEDIHTAGGTHPTVAVPITVLNHGTLDSI